MHRYRIGLFSKLCKSTIKTLRYYDEIGLLKPAYVDPDTGYRYYTSSQLFEVHSITGWRQLGFSLEDMMSLQRGSNTEHLLKQKKLSLEEQKKQISEQLSRITTLMREDKKMNYHAVIKEVPDYIVYSKKMIAPTYDAYFTLIPALGRQVMEKNPDLQCVFPGYCFITYQDDEYKEEDIHIEYSEAVTAFGIEADGIVFKKVPAVTVASIMHKGPYAGLREAYAYGVQWLENSGYSMAGSFRESYIDGIWNTQNEQEWLTEIQIPINKK